MSSIPLSLRDELIASLRHTEQQTENIFMLLAESLPALVREMNQSIERSQNAIACMDGRADGCGEGLQITSLLTETREEMERGAHRFHAMSDSDSSLFSRLQDGIEQLQTITDLIDRIRMDSEDMELVSLNAMTVALKAGTAGRAFSYITEELKRLANRTIALAEEISERGKGLLNTFRALEEALNDARAFQTNLIESFEQRIFTSFRDFQAAVDTTVTGLGNLQDESTELRRPVNGMMEAIQLQDLIRQSIDHIILALQAIEPEEQLDDATELLDELAFTRRIPQLAISLIDDVARQIDESVATFSNLTEEAESKRAELEDHRTAFVEGRNTDTSHPTDESQTTLEDRFQNASSLLRDLLSDLDRNIEKKELLVRRSNEITKEVEELETRFRSFNTLVTRFHSIDIASRIEVAKQEVLRSMGTTSNQMNELTKQIEQDVDASLAATQEFIKSTSTVIGAHQQQFQEQRSFVQHFSESIRERYHALDAGRDEVSSVVNQFSLFTDGFLRVFSESKENGSKLALLSQALRELKTKLNQIQEQIDGRYHEELANRGLETWQIENDRLQAIIDRFTIFGHKAQAGRLAGLEVEEGVGAGEITLF